MHVLYIQKIHTLIVYKKTTTKQQVLLRKENLAFLGVVLCIYVAHTVNRTFLSVKRGEYVTQRAADGF